jgi:hypothetical protein
MAQNRINIEEENRKLAQEKRSVVSDSLQKFQLQVLKLDNNNEVAGELGPLQYLSSLTGYPMDKIINVLLLIIIFVFDPLAISLVIATNFAFDQAYPKKKYRDNLYGEKIEDIQVKDAEEIETLEEFEKNLDKIEKIKEWEAAERRMEIIGQNGNDGEHYSEFDLNKDGVIDDNEKKHLIKKIKKINNKMGGDLKSSPKNVEELIKLEKKLDDLTKIY